VTGKTATRTGDIDISSSPEHTLAGAWLFTWEANDAPSVSIGGVAQGNGSFAPCDAPQSKIQPPRVLQAAWVVPDYPTMLKEQNVQGTTLIAATIGPGGRFYRAGFLKAQVRRSSIKMRSPLQRRQHMPNLKSRGNRLPRPS
jgi:outer membrane biosynthesis protein TonB